MMTSRFLRPVLWLLLALWPAVHAVHAEEELLEPKQAFALSVHVVGANQIEARWQLAPGYYLYRDKIRFTTRNTEVRLGEARFPAGEIKDDEFFGRVEIYRDALTVQLNVEAATAFTLEVEHQGCADIGVCYPPQRESFTLQLPAPFAASPAARSPLERLPGFADRDEPELLEPEQAFAVDALAEDGNTLLVRWDIAPGYYLYRDKLTFLLEQGDGLQLAPVQLPPGQLKDDEIFGEVEVYHGLLEARLPLLRRDPEARQIILQAAFQGCAEIGVCYPPQQQSFTLQLPAGTVTDALNTPAANPPTTTPPLSEQDRLASALAGGNTAWTIMLFFIAGLLLAFTPCVFPMIPILSSIIVGQGEGITTRRAFVLSLTYVLAMAATYTVAGIIAGLFGANLQATFQNPWILGSFAAVFVVLAFAMFGFYELQLPSALQSRISQLSNNQKSGTLTGVAIMGLLSALIVGPCVGPPLMGALIYIGQTGDPWLGGTALFALSMGMGAPLIAIGTAGGRFLPRAGSWMDSVKAVFGVLMLAVAIWMLERILPASIVMVMWAMLLVVAGVYMGALDTIKEGASGWFKLWKGLGLVLVIYGTILLLGVSAGNTDPLQPLRGLGGGGAMAQQQKLEFKYVGNLAELDNELALARRAGLPVMLDFTADWCATCKELERYTFSDPAVINALAGTVLLKADVTANNEADQALLRRYKLIGPPAMLFFGRDGQEQTSFRLVGFISADDFVQHLAQAFAES